MLRIDYLNLKTEIRTGNEAFKDFLKNNFGDFITEAKEIRGEEPDIEVDIAFARAGSGSANDWLGEAERANPMILGNSIRAGRDSVFYHYGAHVIRASRVGGVLRVSGLHLSTRRFRGSALLNHGRWHEVYQAMMRLCVHFPLFSLLQEKGYSVLHASAVAKEGKAILFLGLNGAGKGTSALSLLPELNILADNFLLFDGDYIYGFPETIRISPQVAKSLHLDAGGDMVFGKLQKKNSLKLSEVKAKAEKAIICRRGEMTSWEEMDRNSALAYVEAADRFLHENQAYSYMAFLTNRKTPDRYPDCPFYLATLGGFESARNMLRERLGVINGL